MKTRIILFLLINSFAFTTYAQESNALSFEKIQATRDLNGNYTIKNLTGDSWKIFEGPSVNKINWKKQVGEVKDKPLNIKGNKPEERKYFAAINRQDTFFISERHVPMTGTPNLRDIGGLPASNGRHVKWGLIYRSGAIDGLTPNDLNTFKNLGIKDVVDFRRDVEIEQAPDKYPADYPVNRIRAEIGLSTSNKPEELNKFYQLMKSDTATAQSARQLMIDANQNMAKNVKDYKPMFDELLANEGKEGLLFHCSAGKDRTGVASALILAALGVPEETIIQEYTLTNNYFTSSALKNPRYSSGNAEVIKVVMSAQPEFLMAALEKIKSEYGSIEACLEKELGIDESERKLLIEKYTY